MSDTEFTAEEEEGVVEYAPEPIEVMDGCLVLFDQAEFAEEFDCHGVLVYEACVYVIDRKTRKLRPIELDVTGGKPSLKRVQ